MLRYVWRRRCFRRFVGTFPKRSCEWWVANADARVSRLAGQGIVVTGAVPDRRVHLREATIYVAPYLSGSGSARASSRSDGRGLPIITTSQGIEGMKVQAGRDVLVADQPADIIDSIQTLLASQSDRATVCAGGPPHGGNLVRLESLSLAVGVAVSSAARADTHCVGGDGGRVLTITIVLAQVESGEQP